VSAAEAPYRDRAGIRHQIETPKKDSGCHQSLLSRQPRRERQNQTEHCLVAESQDQDTSEYDAIEDAFFWAAERVLLDIAMVLLVKLSTKNAQRHRQLLVTGRWLVP
jgi:hypothetical protein